MCCGRIRNSSVKLTWMFSIEVERFRFLRIAIPVPWDILEELEPELESKES